MKLNSKFMVKAAVYTSTVVGFFALSAYAALTDPGAAPVGSLGDTAKTVTASFTNLTDLITAVSYLAGAGFTLAALFKFKQHKDNPTQISVGAPIGLLCVGICMLFLPSVFSMSGRTLFADQAQSAGATGISTFDGMGDPTGK